MKEWEKELYIYRLNPAPPKKDDLQEYIDSYFAENDEKYLMWFLHYYESVLNNIATDIVQRYAMYGHFADIKQDVTGIYKALKSYNKAKNGQFITYKVRLMWKEVHSYIRTMRTGFSDNSETVYRIMRKIMYLYYLYGGTNEAITKIAEKVNRSEKYVSEMIAAGLRSISIAEFYKKYADDEDDEMQGDVTVDYTTEPLNILMRLELHNLLKEAFGKLGYREREMIYSHLGLCPECLRFTQKSKTYQEIATENELSSAQAAENEVNRAYEKLRKHIKSNW